MPTLGELPLVSTRVGTITGIIALTFCFQPEAVRVGDSSETIPQAQKITLNSYTLAGVILVLSGGLGGFGFASSDSDVTNQIRMTTADAYIDSTSLERLLISVNTMMQLLPIVPLYSLTASSYIARMLTDWNNTGRETMVTKAVRRIAAMIGVTTMTWIYYVARPVAYITLGIAGGILGFLYIYLLPILLHLKSLDTSEDGSNSDQDYQSIKKDSILQMRPPKSTTGDVDAVGDCRLPWYLILLFVGVGVLTAVLPAAAALGFASQAV